MGHGCVFELTWGGQDSVKARLILDELRKTIAQALAKFVLCKVSSIFGRGSQAKRHEAILDVSAKA